MPFVVDKQSAISAEDLPNLLNSVSNLYYYLERWAGGESQQTVEHAQMMQKHLQTMTAAFYYHQEAVTLHQVLARVEDEDLREDLEDQIDSNVDTMRHLAEAIHGGSRPEDDYVWKFTGFLAAYFHAQNPGQQQSVSQAEVDVMLAAAEDEDEELVPDTARQAIDLDEVDREAGLEGPE